MLRILGRNHGRTKRGVVGAVIGASVALCHPLLFELADVRTLPEAVRAAFAILGWLIGIPGALLIGRGLLTFGFVVFFWAGLGAFVFSRWRSVRDASVDS